MKRYVLPCSCSRRIAVVAGQAGDTLTCPDCGASIVVPRLGTLERLEVETVTPATAGDARRNAAWACLVAGIAIAMLGSAAAGSLRARRTAIVGIDEERIRTVVEAAGIESVHASWLDFEQRGLSAALLPEERLVRQQSQALRGLETVAWTAAVAGVAVAVSALLVAGWSRRGRSAEPA